MKTEPFAHSALERRARSIVTDLFQRVPGIEIRQVVTEPPARLISRSTLGTDTPRPYRPDLEIVIVLGGEEADEPAPPFCWHIYVEAAGRINERNLQTIAAYTHDLPHAVPMLFVPFLRSEAIEACRKIGVCCADDAGNGWIGLGNRVYIERAGNKTPSIHKEGSIPPLSSPKTENVLRVLLNEAGAPRRVWRLQSLATEAGVSVGQAARVKGILDAIGVTEAVSNRRRVGGFRLAHPEEALLEWAGYVRARSYHAGEEHTFHAIDAPQELQRMVTRKLPSFVANRFSLCGEQAAEFYAPYARSPVFSAYVLPEDVVDMDTFKKVMDMDVVTSGVNVVLTIARDPGVFYLPPDLRKSARETRVQESKVPVVSPVQTYLDLQRLGGRAREGAQYLLEQYLRPRWQKETINDPDPRSDASDFTRAINAVLRELADILSDYRNALVVSGGLAMHLLFGEPSAFYTNTAPEDGDFFARVTKDVDLVLNLIQLDRDYNDQMETIGELLLRNLYQQEKQYWVRTVRLPGFATSVTIPVEFLAPTAVRTGGEHPLLAKMTELLEVSPAGLDGVALALLQPKEVLLSGEIPDGTHLTAVPLQVVDPAMLILIKAIAFADRLRKHARNPDSQDHLDHAGKHAYDISQLLYLYPGGVPALVKRLIPPYLTHAGPEQPAIDQALESLRAHFTSTEGQGIRLMVREATYGYEKDDKERAQQGTVGRVRRLLNRIDEKIENTY